MKSISIVVCAASAIFVGICCCDAVGRACAAESSRTNVPQVKELSELLSIPSVSTDVGQTDAAIERMCGFLRRQDVWCAVETWPEDGRKILYKDFISRRRPEATVVLERGSWANDARYFPQFGKPMVGIVEVTTHGDHADDEWIDVKTIDPQVDFMCDYLTGAKG